MLTRLLVLALGASLLGCNASGEVTGGELRGSTSAAVSDAGLGEGGIDGATTWAALYADYFGPKGAASCAGSGACHGDSTQQGAIRSNFVCGASEGACHESIVSSGLVPDGGSSAPDQVNLRFTIRTSAGGTMPKSSQFTFGETDLKRIDEWIRSGAVRANR